MPPRRIAPWKSPGALPELGRLLYTDNGSIQPDNALLQHGCDLVDAYARQDQLPHAIASTAGLARAVLAERCLDSVQDASTASKESAGSATGLLHGPIAAHAIAALYGVAFAAFVTGYLDNRQTGAAKRTMYGLAAATGMPPAFVSRRHAIVHEGYAGLRELQRVAIEGLDWLWENYWRAILKRDGPGSGLEASGGEDDGERDTEAGEDANEIVHEQVAVWAAHAPLSSSRRNESPQDDNRLDAATVMQTILQERGVRNMKRRYTAIVDRLLQDDAMLASFTGIEGERAQIAKWEALLHSLSTQTKHRYTPALIYGLCTRLVRPPLDEARLESRSKGSKKSKPPADPPMQLSESTVNAILAWTHHLCNHPTWVRTLRKRISLRELARPCLENPGPNSTSLAVVLVQSRLWKSISQHKLEQKRRAHQGDSRATSETESLENLVEELTKVTGSTQPENAASTDTDTKMKPDDTAEMEDQQEDMDLDQI